jgi:hypothetical protein
MPHHDPTGELDARFSSPEAKPTPWPLAQRQFAAAEIYWLSTVRPDGRPHVTPLVSVWLDGAAYFATGPTERKAKNLEVNRHCTLTTGRNELDEGLDLVVEGDAVRVTDHAKLQHVADAFSAKYPDPFRFKVQGDGFQSDGGTALVFEIKPAKVLGFGKGETYSQTRWRF